MLKNPPAMQETWLQSLGWKIPWRRAWQPTQVFVPGQSHGQRSLVGYGPRGHRESGTTEGTEHKHAHTENMLPVFKRMGLGTVHCGSHMWLFKLVKIKSD